MMQAGTACTFALHSLCTEDFVCHCHPGLFQPLAETPSQMEAYYNQWQTFNFYVSVLRIYGQDNIQLTVSNPCLIPPIQVQFAQNTCIKIHWFCMSKLAAVSLSTVGTVAVHWPYGKCQSQISSQNTMLLFTMAECYPYG